MKLLILSLFFYFVFFLIGCTSKQTLNKTEKEKLDPQLQQLLLVDNISDAQYIENLVACELTIQEFKWSKSLWPKQNKTPKLSLVCLYLI